VNKPALLVALALAGPAAAQTEPRPLTPEELKVLEEVEGVARRYEAASAAHQETMRGILRKEYGDKVRLLQDRFDSGVGEAEKDYRKHASSTMELLKQFLVKYPNDAKWTPDAMFRLSDLYLDEAKYRWDEKEAAAAMSPEPPPEPAAEDEDLDAAPKYYGPDFSPSVAIWRDIATRFPDYRQIDGTIYLLAYYLGEMRLTAEAMQAYLGLVCRNKFDPMAPPPDAPDPRALRLRRAVAGNLYDDCTPMKDNPDLVEEAWVRIGEIHFDARGELPLAIAAYKKVSDNPKSKFYDIALYKLAWSYYRNNQFLDGITAFDQLVKYSDEQEAQGKPQNDLRGESVQYLAISFADPWEDNALSDPARAIERADAFYKGRTNERHVRDVYEQLGDVLRLSAGTPTTGEVPPEIASAYNSAISAWRFTLENWPLHPRNPLVQQKIVDALAFVGDASGAALERARLAETYRKGGAWYTANETNREAMDIANRLGEGSLLDAARTVHRNAQLAKAAYQKQPTAEGRATYIKFYAQAAQLYASYLQEYPQSSQAYELTFRLADTLFFSEQYLKSVPHYRWVRDHKELGTSHHDEAAESIVKAHEAAVEAAVNEGGLAEPPVPTAETLGQGGPLAVPALYRDLQAAYDEYNKLMKDQTVSAKALAAAMISYRHHDVDDSLERFGKILATNCHSPEAVQAKEGLLAIYQSRGQNDKFQATADKFIKDRCGASQADVELAATQKMFERLPHRGEGVRRRRLRPRGREVLRHLQDHPGDQQGSARRAVQRGAGLRARRQAQDRHLALPGVHQDPGVRLERVLRRGALPYRGVAPERLRLRGGGRHLPQGGRRGGQAQPRVAPRVQPQGCAARRHVQRRVPARPRPRLPRPGQRRPGRGDALQALRGGRDARPRQGEPGVFQRRAGAREGRQHQGDDQDVRGVAQAVRARVGRRLPRCAGAAQDGQGAGEGARQEGRRGLFRAHHPRLRRVGRGAGLAGRRAGRRGAVLAGREVLQGHLRALQGEVAGQHRHPRPEEGGQGGARHGERAAEGRAQHVGRLRGGGALRGLVVAAGHRAPRRHLVLRRAEAARGAGAQGDPRARRAVSRSGVLANYQTALEEQVQPNTDAARDQWLKALQTAKTAGVANAWSKLASQRLNSYIAADLYPTQRDELIDRR
jgi:hypothetical protein